jgi:hypothetical protein
MIYYTVLLISAAPQASIQHLLNLHFRPEGLGAIFAERSDWQKL